MRDVLLLAVLCTSGFVGCRGTTVATQNLDAVLSSADTFRYRGTTTGPWRDLLDTGLSSLRSVVKASDRPKEERSIPDPTALSVENLARLAKSTQGAPAWRQNEQVRVLARFAAYAPSQLCRELAVRQLLAHGKRLEVSGPFVPAGVPASAAELIESIDGLTDALRGASGRRLDDTARADFAAAIELVEALEVDVQGGARLLGAISPFLAGRLLSGDLRERLAELSLRVQERMVAEALWRALRDSSGLVRGAAMQVSLELHGEDFRVEALLSLVSSSRASPWIMEAYREFDLPRQDPLSSPVYLAVTENYAAERLPFAARRDTVKGLQLRSALVMALLQIAVSEELYSRRAQHGAAQALSALTSGEVNSLRPEVWEAWWDDVSLALQEQIQAASDD